MALGLLWSNHHLGVGAGHPAVMAALAAALPVALGLITQLLDKADQETVGARFRNVVARVVTWRLLLILYLALGVVALTWTSVVVQGDEANPVARASLLRGDTSWTSTQAQSRPLDPSDILVVAPYNAQVSALKRALEAVGVARVGTVDKFQGQEAPVVIYSCTSSSPADAPRGMAFLYDPHRINVATSRARSTVIVVASPQLFEPDCRTPAQMAWANGVCRFAEMARRVVMS